MNAKEINRAIDEAARLFAGEASPPWRRVTAFYSAPLLYGFCSWVMEQAHKKGLKRLYFLARDGYALHKLCRMIAGKRAYDIKCSYLYASRLAWRVPGYHLIGDEAYEMIFMRAYRLTLRGIFQRFQASEDECVQCARLAGASPEMLDRPMAVHELERVKDVLSGNPQFRSLVEEKSKAAYGPAIAYLRQEGLLDGDPVAVVDTGWTGSIQRSLRQLLRSAGGNGGISGFYFGLYQEPKDPADGDYMAWYFSRRSPVHDRILFNNNVLESMCAAPHPMTCGYREQHSSIIPIWKNTAGNAQGSSRAESQCRLMLEVGEALEGQVPAGDGAVLLQCLKRRMKKLCVHPSADEARAFSECLFCDDASESYLTPLVKDISQEEARAYFVPRRLLNRNRKRVKKRADLFWPYGCFAVSNIRWKAWYRFNVYLWDVAWSFRK